MDSTSEIAVSLPFGNFFKINSFAQNAGLEQQNKKKKKKDLSLLISFSKITFISSL